MTRLLKYITLIAVLQLILCLGISVQVQAAAATLISISSGKVGDTVAVSGSGFTLNEAMEITFDSDPKVNFIMDSTGNFSKSFQVPPTVQGVHFITIVGTTNAGPFNHAFTVNPSISLNKTGGEVGTSVTVTGSAFDSGESGIVLKFDDVNNTQAGTTQVASALGSWTASFTVPAISAGTHVLTATGGGGTTASVNFTVIVIAKISSNKTSGTVGSQVSVSGTGFAANEAGVRVTLGDSTHSFPVSVSSTGSWTANITVPALPGGSYILDASGNTTTSVGDLSFSVTPTVSINPTSAAPGALITVEGNGFGASEAIILSYDTTDLQTGIKADPNGNFSGTITVPSGSGIHKIYARGTVTPKNPISGIDFKVNANISINKASGAAGSVISVSGVGFAANEAGLNIIFDGTKTPITATASAIGAWTANFTIPVASGGEHKIDAEGRSTLAASVTEITFNVLPQISIDKTEGAGGTAISISGNGFSAGETGISINYDGKALGPKLTADASGTWKATVTIPPSFSGQHTLQVNGSVTTSLVVGELSFEVKPTMSISPAEGFIGSAVSVSGSGFSANSNIRISFDNIEINSGLLTSDSGGNFNRTITIPKAAGGTHVIRVQDNKGESFEAAFHLDAEAPAQPKISGPADGTKIGLFGNITPTLEWSKVTDPSGVTYNLQLDSDAEFGNPLIDVTGMTANKYTVKKSDALPRGQYYWRVQAVDGAANTSSWTEPVILFSGKISPVLFSLIIVFVVVAVGVAIYLLLPVLRRRSRMAQPQVAPEIVIPEVVNAEYKQIEGGKQGLPWRLALPQAPQPVKGSKSALSGEDQARLKVIIDFAKSVPLAEPGANTNWLLELAESNTGLAASPVLYSQLVKGEIQLHYEPAWIHHPTYLDLQSLLEGQPILQDLSTFVDSVNRTAADAEAALNDIYQEIAAEISWDIFANGGWTYISAVYLDSFNWFQGKYLKEPSDRDYSLKAEALASGGNGFGLYAEAHTPFAGLLIQAVEEKDAQQLRALHLKMRRNFRNSDRMKTVVASVLQLEVQRNRLTNTFSQFNRLNPV